MPQRMYDRTITDFLPTLSESLPKGSENKAATAVNTRYRTGMKDALNPRVFA
jgi:hypothetical protein